MEKQESSYKRNRSKYRGVRPLSMALDVLTKPVFIKRGFAESRIITDWEKIVGKAIALHSIPRKLSFSRDRHVNGTLYIDVNNSGFATELLYFEPIILEKISCYFGYKAVSKLKITQNLNFPIKTPNKESVKQPLQKEAVEKLESLISSIDDPELKSSLRSLGSGILE